MREEQEGVRTRRTGQRGPGAEAFVRWPPSSTFTPAQEGSSPLAPVAITNGLLVRLILPIVLV